MSFNRFRLHVRVDDKDVNMATQLLGIDFTVAGFLHTHIRQHFGPVMLRVQDCKDQDFVHEKTGTKRRIEKSDDQGETWSATDLSVTFL